MNNHQLSLLLHLRYAQGYTFQQCQEMTGVPKHTIRRLMLPHKHRHKASVVIERSILKRKAQFWTLVDITADPDACWEWQGGRYPTPRHYGRASILHFTRTKYAHVMAFILHNGKKPKRWVLHKCDNPPCCNPHHLYDGTPQENSWDREARGRHPLHK